MFEIVESEWKKVIVVVLSNFKLLFSLSIASLIVFSEISSNFILVFLIGTLVGIFFTIMNTTRISKKDEQEFDIFLSQREERIKKLAEQAKELQRNY